MFHSRPHRGLTSLAQRISLLLLVANLPACQPLALKDDRAGTERPRVVTAQSEETVRRQKNRIMELELRLLAKQSEIQRLSASHEQALQEIVRVTAKLRSRSSKAETVANLAEAKLAIEGMEARKGGTSQSKPLEYARQYIAMSEAALESGNYDGASFLINQANVSLRTANSSAEDPADTGSNLTTFSLPTQMTVRQRSNVRAGPGLEKKVLYQLNRGKSVLATGYQGLWVQIQSDRQPAGWIHFSLLDANL